MKTIALVRHMPTLEFHTTLTDPSGASLSLKVITYPLLETMFAEMAFHVFSADAILIDANLFYSVANSDPYDVVQTISTLMRCFPKKTIPIAMVIDDDTSIQTIKDLMRAGVKSICPNGKEFSISEKEQAMIEILSNTTHIPNKIKEKLYPNKKSKSINLTPRQAEILDLVTHRGASNKVIAKMLNITESTVKLHISAIFKKYGVRNRTQLAVFASQHSA